MIEIIDCAQGESAWYEARRGIATASRFATVMASGKDGGDSRTRREYLLRLAGEIITGEISETFSNSHMERGKQMEDEARKCYTFMTDAEPRQVGFIRNGPKGCSPDSLIGENGMLEIKTAMPHILLDKILRGSFPPEHKAQCQGNLWVGEREWIDLTIYWPKMPPFIKRATRDEPYIRTLSDAVDAFNSELAEIVERIRQRAA